MIEDRGPAESETAVAADAEAAGKDSACLSWLVKLELVVCSDVSCPTLGIEEHTTLESQRKSIVIRASDHGDTGPCGCLWLSVGDLRDGSARGCLWLAVCDLRYGRGIACRGLWLTISDLRYRSSGARWGLWLAI